MSYVGSIYVRHLRGSLKDTKATCRRRKLKSNTWRNGLAQGRRSIFIIIWKLFVKVNIINKREVHCLKILKKLYQVIIIREISGNESKVANSSSQRIKSKLRKQIADNICEKKIWIRKGTSFSVILCRYPKLFPNTTMH